MYVFTVRRTLEAECSTVLRSEWRPCTRNLILFTPDLKVTLFAKEMALLEVKIFFADNTTISLCDKNQQAGFFNFEGRIFSALKLCYNNDEDFEASEITDMYDGMWGNDASLQANVRILIERG